MSSVARLLRAAVIATSCLAAVVIGGGLVLQARGAFAERSAVYGFKIVARVTVADTTYAGEAHTRCRAYQRFPYLGGIEFEQHGETLALRIDRGRVLFVDFGEFGRSCHPADALWKSASMAPWERFTAVLAQAMRSRQQIPIDPGRAFIADDAIRPRQLVSLDPAASAIAGVRIDELYLEPSADASPQTGAASLAQVFPWSRSAEHQSDDPLQCYSFAWDHIIIERASFPHADVIATVLKRSPTERFVDLTEDMTVQQRAALFRLGRPSRVELADDRMTVRLRHPANPRLVHYLPGPTVPWHSGWRPPAARVGEPFDFPWNPRFCLNDEACFQLPADRTMNTTNRYVLDRRTLIVHRLHLARRPFWSNAFGGELRETHCPFG
jgi:hypothetical protein